MAKITIRLEPSKSGVHKCEVASGLEKYLPCPWPGCKHGVIYDWLRKPVEDDFAYSLVNQEKLSSGGPLVKAEVYQRRVDSKTHRYMWSFEREE